MTIPAWFPTDILDLAAMQTTVLGGGLPMPVKKFTLSVWSCATVKMQCVGPADNFSRSIFQLSLGTYGSQVEDKQLAQCSIYAVNTPGLFGQIVLGGVGHTAVMSGDVNYYEEWSLDHKTYYYSNARTHWLLAVDFENQTMECYANGQRLEMTTGAWGVHQLPFAFGLDPLTITYYSGTTGEGYGDIWMSSEYHDITNPAFRAQFINEDYTAINLPADGHIVVGGVTTNPVIYLRVDSFGVPQDFLHNRGTGPDWKLIGGALSFAPYDCTYSQKGNELFCFHAYDFPVYSEDLFSAPDGESKFRYSADFILGEKSNFLFRVSRYTGGIHIMDLYVGWITGGGPTGDGPGYGVSVLVYDANGQSNFMTGLFGPIATPVGQQFHIQINMDTMTGLLTAEENGVAMTRHSFFPGSPGFVTDRFGRIDLSYAASESNEHGCIGDVLLNTGDHFHYYDPYVYLRLISGYGPSSFLSNDAGNAGGFRKEGARHSCTACTDTVVLPPVQIDDVKALLGARPVSIVMEAVAGPPWAAGVAMGLSDIACLCAACENDCLPAAREFSCLPPGRRKC